MKKKEKKKKKEHFIYFLSPCPKSFSSASWIPLGSGSAKYRGISHARFWIISLTLWPLILLPPSCLFSHTHSPLFSCLLLCTSHSKCRHKKCVISFPIGWFLSAFSTISIPSGLCYKWMNWDCYWGGLQRSIGNMYLSIPNRQTNKLSTCCFYSWMWSITALSRTTLFQA